MQFVAAKMTWILLVCGALASTDDAAIRGLQVRQADAWNAHDAAAYARLFAEDADLVTVLGWWWKGRVEIENRLRPAFANAFAESRLTIGDVQLRLLSPTIAIARVRWTMTGAKMPPGVPEPRAGIQLQVLEKRDAQWSIVSFQNTNSIPEVSFPSAGAR